MNKLIAALGVAVVLATAPQVFAFGGGGGHRGGGGGANSATLPDARPATAADQFGVTSIGGSTAPGGPLSAPEPFAALAVGLGLAGARLLRRR